MRSLQALAHVQAPSLGKKYLITEDRAGVDLCVIMFIYLVGFTSEQNAAMAVVLLVKRVSCWHFTLAVLTVKPSRERRQQSEFPPPVVSHIIFESNRNRWRIVDIFFFFFFFAAILYET